MLLREVEYARPSSVREAVQLLSGHDNARALAGGQSLVNVMKLRVASPDLVVDLNGIEELREIRSTADGGLELGAMATYSDILLSPDVAAARPILAEVANAIADVQVRNRGTIGGNVCSNDPTNHFPPVAAAVGASFVIAGGGGERVVPAEEFFEGVYATAVRTDELLTKITIPAAAGSGDGFASVAIGRDGTGIVNVAACVNGGARVAIGCVAAVPVLVTAASTDEDTIVEAVRGAGLDPPSDVHGSGEFRRHLAEVLAARAVRAASERAG